jgi:hypothetical protein
MKLQTGRSEAGCRRSPAIGGAFTLLIDQLGYFYAAAHTVCNIRAASKDFKHIPLTNRRLPI